MAEKEETGGNGEEAEGEGLTCLIETFYLKLYKFGIIYYYKCRFLLNSFFFKGGGHPERNGRAGA